MSTVMVVAPIIIANWPLISLAVTGAVSSMGFATAEAVANQLHSSSEETETKPKVEISIENSEIMPSENGMGEEMVVEKEGVVARFSRDARGALRLCMEGDGHSKAELNQIGEELIGRVTQQYAYHRIITEMKNRNMTIVREEVDTDNTVRIRVKNW